MAINYMEHIQILINKLQTMTLIFHFISSEAFQEEKIFCFGKLCRENSARLQRSNGENFAINLSF